MTKLNLAEKQALIGGWGTPEPVDVIDRTPLPPSAERWPRPLWRFVDAVAVAHQVPRDMVLMLVLSILSTATGGRWRVQVTPDWAEPLAVFTVTTMQSGSRKSAAVKSTAGPLFAVERELAERFAPRISEQRALKDIRVGEYERLKKQIGRPASQGQPKVTEADVVAAAQAVDEIDEIAVPRLVADDVTPEKLGALMGEQGGRMGVVSAEGGLFQILSGRYSSGQPNLDLVLKAHAGDTVRIDRLSRPPLLINDPFLAIGVTVQPDVLEGLAETKMFRGSGLLARVLFATPRTLLGHRVIEPDPIPELVNAAYFAAVADLTRRAWAFDEVVDLKLDDEAAHLLRDFRTQLEPQLDPDGGELAEITDWASKLPGALVRIAALLTLYANPNAQTVGQRGMAEALGLAPYLVGQAQNAFDAINGRHARSGRLRAVVAWLRRKKISEFTIRQIRRDLGGQEWAKDVDNVRDAVEDLEELGWVRLKERDAGTPSRAGRPPSERYEVNPAAHRSR